MIKLLKYLILIVLASNILFILSSCSKSEEYANSSTITAEVVDETGNESTGIKVINALDKIEVENLNNAKNTKVSLQLPEGWTSTAYIQPKAEGFEFKDEKNRHITEAYSYEIYDDKARLKGRFEMPSYYRDQPDIARFPNHSALKRRLYSGHTLLGTGDIFLLDCDWPDAEDTNKTIYYSKIYAWIPINNEELAYNLYFDISQGEDIDRYLGIMKEMLGAERESKE